VFEKMSRAAERLATNVSASRRGFLGRVGQAALGVAGVFAGLLALPREARAATRSGYCQAGLQRYALAHLIGYCVCPQTLTNPCLRQFNNTCQGYGNSIISLCGLRVATSRPCTCT
jgi:hypothetical protein